MCVEFAFGFFIFLHYTLLCHGKLMIHLAGSAAAVVKEVGVAVYFMCTLAS